jgi:hypothetical protein
MSKKSIPTRNFPSERARGPAAGLKNPAAARKMRRATPYGP